ncbi:phage tail assembly protein [Limnobaculum xujianqingii]|uniref:phage tail assembly protein n=1 Tax=Limnobaculum xujianqingii TaxID=2738837 RepID=UPI001126B1D7|nr:phage tail assembly protein [Limnobaculum xujianqingii]
MNITLIDGLVVGKEDNQVTHKEVVIRELTAGDMMTAQTASERVVETRQGAKLVSSPSQMTYEMMRRAVVSIGPVQGPVSLAELGKLSQRDFGLLNDSIMALQELRLGEEVESQGREPATRSGD